MKTLNILFLLLLCIRFHVNGQSSQIPKLKELQKEIRQASYYDSATVFEKGSKGIRLAQKLKRKQDESLIYQYYGNFSYFSGKVIQANKYYDKSIELAKAAHSKELINSTLIRKTFIEMDTNIVAANEHFFQLLDEAKKGGYVKNQIEIYNGLGILHEEKMMQDRALYYYQIGLRIAEKHQEKYMTAFLLNNIGLLKFNNKQLQEAKRDLERGLNLTKGMNEPRLALNLLNNLGLVYGDLKNYKQAINHYKLTVIEAKKIGFPNGIFAAYLNLSANYLQTHQLKEAKEILDTTKTYFNQLTDPNYRGAWYIQVAKTSLELKDFNQTEKDIKILESFLKLHPDLIQSYEMLVIKSDFAKARGDYKNAYHLHEQVLNFSDSITQLSNQQELSKLQTIYGKERMENELDEIKNKNKLLKTESKLKTANLQLSSLIFVLILVTISAFFYIQYIRKTKAVREEFSKNLLVEVDEERSRISKDLHDDIGQALSIIKSKINLHQKGKLEHLEGVEQEIGSVIDQTRKISHELHPSGIEKIGLAKMLNNMLEKVENATGLFTSIDWDFSDEILSKNQQTQLYRMLQECTNNTIKHANASALKIQGIVKKEHIEIQYMDNGIGLTNQQLKKGLGFQTLLERTLLLSGKIEIKTNQPQGIVLHFHIPRI